MYSGLWRLQLWLLPTYHDFASISFLFVVEGLVSSIPQDQLQSFCGSCCPQDPQTQGSGHLTRCHPHLTDTHHQENVTNAEPYLNQPHLKNLSCNKGHLDSFDLHKSKWKTKYTAQTLNRRGHWSYPAAGSMDEYCLACFSMCSAS